jgi:hypothetical protein
MLYINGWSELQGTTTHSSGNGPLPDSSCNSPLCRPAHSSIHFDPYHNLLCVVTGTKTVTLMDPGCTPGLYARPLEGESSNHSSVDFTAPDPQAHPLYRWVRRLLSITAALPPTRTAFCGAGICACLKSSLLRRSPSLTPPDKIPLLPPGAYVNVPHVLLCTP